MHSLDLFDYPSSEPVEMFWVRMSLLSALIDQAPLFVWEPAPVEPRLLGQYRVLEGIDTAPEALTYLLVGEASDERNRALESSLRFGQLPEHPAIVTIPVASSSLIGAIIGATVNPASTQRLSPGGLCCMVRACNRDIGVSLRAERCSNGERAVCTLGAHAIAPSTFRRAFPPMQVSQDRVFYRPPRGLWRLLGW